MARGPAKQRGVRFSYHYIDRVRRASLAAMTSNADIARILRRVDTRITVSKVVEWREQYPQFDRVCNDALDEQLEELAGVLYQAGIDGSESAARYLLDRLHPSFMPKQKNETTFKGETLDDLLRRRTISEDELKARGVLVDPETPDEDRYD